MLARDTGPAAPLSPHGSERALNDLARCLTAGLRMGDTRRSMQ